MISHFAKQFIDDVAKHLPASGEAIASAFSEQGSDAHRQLNVCIEATLRKMNVVSRDEFDAQTAVLQRTRKKVDALEKQLQTLESALK
ncbi:MAG: BMFP domain-containing protein YqiC [Candidatus Endobugula sp.]|jgi:BMFP domain-containing protein YqiC